MLNSQQLEAVTCQDKKILCLAGAGTGKTYTMISRMQHLVKQKVNPTSILALTFTNAASLEMKERYITAAPSGLLPEFKTFHAFCYYLICVDPYVREAIHYSRIPDVASEGEANRICTTARLQVGKNLTKSQLDGKNLVSYRDKRQYEIYDKAMRRMLQNENLITFDILCKDVCALFTSDSPSIRLYKTRFKYIFVDEFQDTDPVQWKFVSSFKDAHLFVVGDALQSIYSFRGADSSIIKQLSMNEDWTTIKLTQNYRSTQQICNFANKMSKYAEDSYRIPIAAERSGDIVHVWKSDSIPLYESVDGRNLQHIAEDIKKDNSSKTIAVLCRTNREVSEVSEFLQAQGLLSKGKNPTVYDATLIQACKDDNYFADWLSTYLPREFYYEYIRNVYMMTDLNISRLGLLLSKYGASDTIHKLYEQMDQLRMSDAMYSSNNEQRIHVGTIHSSKGLEYDSVYLVGVNDRSFRLTDTESKNLYYVGITRARDKLTVCYANE